MPCWLMPLGGLLFSEGRREGRYADLGESGGVGERLQGEGGVIALMI